MEFNNYCLLILGKINNDEVKNILTRISEENVNFLEAKGLFMATFVSVLKPTEIKESFSDGNKSILVFKLDEMISSVELADKEKQEILFGDIFNNLKLTEELTNNYGSMISVDKINNTKQVHINFIKTIDDMSKKEKVELADSIIDKGLENLTDKDRDILEKISKLG